MWNSTGCPSINAQMINQANFWNETSAHWNQHRAGWAASGGCALLTVLITTYSVMMHALNYRVPAEQRQIIRILYMPPVVATISFFSYRFFRQYTYYSVSEVVYEATVVAAFMMLLIESFASTAHASTSGEALLRKDKCSLPFPFCCWRYRPTKAYFMYMIKWSVMQYTIIQPIICVISVVTQSFNLLCISSFSPRFANMYLTIVSLLSNAIAVYGLVIFYNLTKADLKGKRPGAKFWCVNIIVTVPFIQQLFFSILQGAGVFKATTFWTSTNVANGLDALSMSAEMVIFSLFMAWAFPVSEYKNAHQPKQRAWKALWDSVNFSDFVVETWRSIKFFVEYVRDNLKPGACGSHTVTRKTDHAGPTKKNFAEAFMKRRSSMLGERWKGISRFDRSRGPGSAKVDSVTISMKEVWEAPLPPLDGGQQESIEIELTAGQPGGDGEA
ncbi:DUF300-domain-containing protein [Tricholoma matsutake]|nr:DUF300-domain-containing protein [Tricholoma matsutake 945]